MGKLVMLVLLLMMMTLLLLVTLVLAAAAPVVAGARGSSVPSSLWRRENLLQLFVPRRQANSSR
jgi:hypothetical protein